MTESEYIYLYDDPVAQLAAIKAIITALDAVTLQVAEKGGIAEYMLDDGQVILKRKYSSVVDIAKSRLFYTQEANRLLGQINGRTNKIIPCLG